MQDVDVWTAKLWILLVYRDLLTVKALMQQLKKTPFHFWIDTFCALLIAAYNAGLWSREQLQALHQWSNGLLIVDAICHKDIMWGRLEVRHIFTPWQ